MKLYAFNQNGTILFLTGPANVGNSEYIGTIEIETPKKMVKYENMINISGFDWSPGTSHIPVTMRIPINATNVKITYEVEE